MRKGIDSIKKAVKDAKAPLGSFAGSLGYFGLKDGDSKVIRFVTDVPDIITASFYEFVTNSTGTVKTQNFIVYTDLHDGNGEDYVLKHGGKTRDKGLVGDLVDPKPKERTVAIVVEQEEVQQTVNGKNVIGYQDVIEEIEVGGEKFPSRKFLILKQASQNFWEPMIGFYDEYGTLCDRPYKITRSGAQVDTTYQIVPKREDPSFDLKEHYAFYGYGETRDDKDPERFLFCPQTLDDWCEYYGSEERVKRFLLGESSDQTQTQSNGSSQSQQASAARTPSGADEFHKDTTHNPDNGADEAQASVVPPSTTTDHSALRDRLARHRK